MALFQAASIKQCVWFSFFIVVLCVCVFLGNFVELIQGGGLCLCEEGASQTRCLGFTLCCALHARFTLSFSGSSVTIRSDSVK